MTVDYQASDPALPKRRGLIISIGLNGVLFILVCGLALYAFMLKVDLDEGKRRLSKEVETRQQTERYLIETRNLLTSSLREIEQLKAQLAYKESDYQAAVSVKPALPVVVEFRASLLGQGLVAVINNTSDRYLTLVLAVRNPTLSTVKRFKLELNPKSSTDFGHLEGWQFASGDEVGLFNDEFGALKLTVP
jgi:flagellar basal body-associated protein FliL